MHNDETLVKVGDNCGYNSAKMTLVGAWIGKRLYQLIYPFTWLIPVCGGNQSTTPFREHSYATIIIQVCVTNGGLTPSLSYSK